MKQTPVTIKFTMNSTELSGYRDYEEILETFMADMDNLGIVVSNIEVDEEEIDDN